MTIFISAGYFDLRYMRDQSSPYLYMLCSEKTFSDFLKLHNIKVTSRVVLYDQKAGQPFWATRVFWMFRTFGLKNVSVLNGGLTKWIAEGRKTQSDADIGTEDDYKVKIDPSIYRTYAQIAEIENEIANGKSDTTIIDARPEPSYTAGHIPVAKNLCFKKFQNEDGTVKSPEQVKQAIIDSGIDPAKPIINSCGGGVSATYNFAAMLSAGVSNIALYDGSWSEYVSSFIY